MREWMKDIVVIVAFAGTVSFILTEFIQAIADIIHWVIRRKNRRR